MRRHLTAVMVGIVGGALLLAGVGTYLLASRGVRTDAAAQELRQARVVAAEVPVVLRVRSRPVRRQMLGVLRRTDGLRFVTVTPAGRLTGVVPAPLVEADLQPARLSGGLAVSGTAHGEVYAAVPVPTLSGRGHGGTVVVLLVQRVGSAPLGLVYLLLVSGGVLAAAGVVAGYVSRRITRPLFDAVATTRRIAEGDLGARVPHDPRGHPELDSLATSINSMAEALGRSATAQRQFLLSVSHDLRTPLTSILGYAEAIGDGTVADARSAAQVIAEEGRRLDRLVGDLLELARLRTQEFAMHPVPTDLALGVRQAAEALRPAVEAASLTLSVAVPAPGAVVAVVDPDRLSQIVANLVENAYKYAAQRVQVGTGVATGAAVVTVDDDGPGIAPEDRARVFDRFFQGTDHRSARRGGSGLGLAIVAELVAAMGGDVRVLPVYPTGRGTRIELHLPLAPIGRPIPGRWRE